MILKELYSMCPDNILVVDDLLDENVLMYLDHRVSSEPTWLMNEILDSKIQHLFISERHKRSICVVLEPIHE